MNYYISKCPVRSLISICTLHYCSWHVCLRHLQSIMQQQKDIFLQLSCAACTIQFSQQLYPFISCRNAHLSCEKCLIDQARGYQYASFLCPLCQAPTCKAAAVKCEWLPAFLALSRKKEKKVNEENKELLQENSALKERLLCMDFKMIKTRSKLEKLQKWRSNFIVNCQKVLDGTISKKLLDGRFTEKDLQNSQGCFDNILVQIKRLVEDNRSKQKTIERLKMENAAIAQRFQAIRSDKQSVELTWSGTYAKPSTASKLRTANYSRESLATASIDKQRPKVVRQDNFFTPNFVELFKDKIRNEQQSNSDKKSQSKNKTYKKYLNMKIEGLDEKILDANPKFNRLNSNLKKLRDVFDSSTIKKKAH